MGVAVCVIDGVAVGVDVDVSVAVSVECFFFVLVGRTIGTLTLVFVAWMGTGNVGVLVCMDVGINNGDSVNVGVIVGA